MRRHEATRGDGGGAAGSEAAVRSRGSTSRSKSNKSLKSRENFVNTRLEGW